MNRQAALSLFTARGVELEYMIVDAESLAVRPISDRLLRAVDGTYPTEVDLGEFSWSNELALHVVEIKTTDPARELAPLVAGFQSQIRTMNERLETLGARLMPSAMHPWMDPTEEMRLWPHESSPIYEAFHRIFDCRGHGWANLQSVHLNLPFANDAEFGALHAAVRLVLPLLPALAASSPILGGRRTGSLDNRLEVYRTNARRIPSVTGDVIPEPVFARADYERTILQRMYADIAPHDPAGTLQHEWLNARGAIARFDRRTIEIRVLDVQECPLADLAIVAAIEHVLKSLVDEQWTSASAQKSAPTVTLARLLAATTRDADLAIVDDQEYLAHFGLSGRGGISAGDVWRSLLKTMTSGDDAPWEKPLDVILSLGPLARRIERAIGLDVTPASLRRVYGALCDTLGTGTMFVPAV